MNLEITSYDELRALHVTICEAKFHEDPNKREIQGSPFVADIAHKVYDMLISEAPNDDLAQSWASHRVLVKESSMYPVVVQRCSDYFAENELSSDYRRKYLMDVAAPFRVPEEIEAQIIEPQ